MTAFSQIETQVGITLPQSHDVHLLCQLVQSVASQQEVFSCYTFENFFVKSLHCFHQLALNHVLLDHHCRRLITCLRLIMPHGASSGVYREHSWS